MIPPPVFESDRKVEGVENFVHFRASLSECDVVLRIFGPYFFFWKKLLRRRKIHLPKFFLKKINSISKNSSILRIFIHF